MGVNPIPTNFKTLTFDGENSGAYGVYITGEGVFNAPERSVEMIEIAGRNGAYALDKGNFSNIEVTYPAGIVAETEADFAEAISDFRNLLCSRRGYVRLTDEYNPNEYRLAIYKSGLDVDHEGLLTGEFNIVFDCKPQRYLTSGESAIAVTSGNTITNPTLFDSQPMLEVWGYGTIGINNQSVKIISKAIGDIIVFNREYYDEDDLRSGDLSITFDAQYANLGDQITFMDAVYERGITMGYGKNITNVTANISGQGNVSATIGGAPYNANVTISIGQCNFVYGTASSVSTTGTFVLDLYNGEQRTITIKLSVDYDGADEIVFERQVTLSVNDVYWLWENADINTITLNSSQSALGSPIYIDLEIGEAYKEEGGVPVSVNNAVSMPGNLPTLESGANVITYDNTITQLNVIPRWWKV